MSIANDLDKILSHLCMARSNALGAQSGLTGGVIDEEIDLKSVCAFTGSDADHSAQFLSYFAKRRVFWENLADKMKIKTKVK